jgi:hypothetical protein
MLRLAGTCLWGHDLETFVEVESITIDTFVKKNRITSMRNFCGCALLLREDRVGDASCDSEAALCEKRSTVNAEQLMRRREDDSAEHVRAGVRTAQSWPGERGIYVEKTELGNSRIGCCNGDRSCRSD